eukprot:g60780.t1
MSASFSLLFADSERLVSQSVEIAESLQPGKRTYMLRFIDAILVQGPQLQSTLPVSLMSRSTQDTPEMKRRRDRLMAIQNAKKDNKFCFECGTKHPTWAATNLGVFICFNCSGKHRNLGVHISTVRSTKIDNWNEEWVDFMEAMGNKRARAYWEARVGVGVKPGPMDGDEVIDAFIRNKYVKKLYVKPNVQLPDRDLWLSLNRPKVRSMLKEGDDQDEEEEDKPKKKKKDRSRKKERSANEAEKPPAPGPAPPKPANNPKPAAPSTSNQKPKQAAKPAQANSGGGLDDLLNFDSLNISDSGDDSLFDNLLSPSMPSGPVKPIAAKPAPPVAQPAPAQKATPAGREAFDLFGSAPSAQADHSAQAKKNVLDLFDGPGPSLLPNMQQQSPPQYPGYPPQMRYQHAGPYPPPMMQGGYGYPQPGWGMMPPAQQGGYGYAPGMQMQNMQQVPPQVAGQRARPTKNDVLNLF